MGPETVVAVEDAAVEYKLRERDTVTIKALDGVSIHLLEGESVGVVGESGSGKSTLARLISGLETPSRGRVEVCGESRGTVRPRGAARRRRGRELQMVFQDPYSSLDPRQQIDEALDEVLRLHFRDLSRGERAKRTSDLLEQVGLTGRGDQTSMLALRRRSQRAAIARALAVDPQIWLLDEAVAALDVSIQAEVLNLLADLRESTNTAYLFLSHDLSVVRYVTERVAVMRNGQIVEEGPTARVLSRPEHPYTQLLLNCTPRPRMEPSASRHSRKDRHMTEAAVHGGIARLKYGPTRPVAAGRTPGPSFRR